MSIPIQIHSHTAVIVTVSPGGARLKTWMPSS